MLSLRCLQMMGLFVLAVLSICAVTGYTNHVEQDNGELWDDQVLWQIATGDHEWNDTDTYSYHYMYVENNLNTWVRLTYKWRHEFKEDDDLLQFDQIGNELTINSGDTYSTAGWLNTYTAEEIDAGSYSIKSTTKIKMRTGNNFSQDWLSVSKITHFRVEE